MKKSLLIALLAAFAVCACTKEPNDLDKKPEEIIPYHGNGGDKDKEEGEDTPPTPTGAVVYGYVKDNSGAAIANVVVSDGYSCARTDTKGYYVIESKCPTRAKFAIASVPSGYEPVVKSGVPVFFQRIDAYQEGQPRKAADIILNRTVPLNDFYMLVTADPQSRTPASTNKEQIAYTSESVYLDHFTDMKETVDKLDKPCFGWALGDICFNATVVYPQYLAGIQSVGVPFYSVIGNHDHNNVATSHNDDECAAPFEDVFGPRNYSYNIGNVHFVSLDNVYFATKDTGFCGANGDYTHEIEPAFLDWLEDDLKYVSKDKILMIGLHVPIMSQTGFKAGSYNTRLKEIVSSFRKVYIWSGHTHQMENCANFTDASLANIESHTISRVTGRLVLNEYACVDGVPRGYVVMHVQGGNVSWQFKPTAIQTGLHYNATGLDYKFREWDYENGRAVMKDGSGELDSKYQMRAYSRGDYDDDFVYANVFMWDRNWEYPTLTIGDKTYKMEKHDFYDLGYKEYIVHYNRVSSVFAKSGDSFAGGADHHFTFRVPEGSQGTGTVSVKDPFGNTYTRKVSVAPIQYTDGATHLVFDLSKCPEGWNTTQLTDQTLKYVLDGTTYEFVSTKGRYNVAGGNYALESSGNTLMLPAIPGKKLVGVTIRIVNNTQTRKISITTGTLGGTVQGGEEYLVNGDCSVSWNITGSEVGKNYYIYNGGYGIPIAELRLAYK